MKFTAKIEIHDSPEEVLDKIQAAEGSTPADITSYILGTIASNLDYDNIRATVTVASV